MESDLTGVCAVSDGTQRRKAQDKYSAQRAFMFLEVCLGIQEQCTRRQSVDVRNHEKRIAKSEFFYELLFTASRLDLAKRISVTSRIAPITIALSAMLKSGQL